MAQKIQIIIGSIRPGRKGEAVAKHVYEIAKARPGFDYELVDLLDYNLPLLDEANLAMMDKYEHDHTKKWSAKVAEADAYVFVTPEYNHGYPASLKNAIDYLYKEWKDKPVGFVSYGSATGGARAVEQLLQVVKHVGMLPVQTSAIVPNVYDALDDAGKVKDPRFAETVAAVLGEVEKLTSQLAA